MIVLDDDNDVVVTTDIVVRAIFFSSRLSAMHISTAILYILDKYIYIEIYIYSVSYFSIMLLFFIFMCANIIATASPRIAVIR